MKKIIAICLALLMCSTVGAIAATSQGSINMTEAEFEAFVNALDNAYDEWERDEPRFIIYSLPDDKQDEYYAKSAEIRDHLTPLAVDFYTAGNYAAAWEIYKQLYSALIALAESYTIQAPLSLWNMVTPSTNSETMTIAEFKVLTIALDEAYDEWESEEPRFIIYSLPDNEQNKYYAESSEIWDHLTPLAVDFYTAGNYDAAWEIYKQLYSALIALAESYTIQAPLSLWNMVGGRPEEPGTTIPSITTTATISQTTTTNTTSTTATTTSPTTTTTNASTPTTTTSPTTTITTTPTTTMTTQPGGGQTDTGEKFFTLWGRTTSWEKTPFNWILLIVFFGWIWMR